MRFRDRSVRRDPAVVIAEMFLSPSPSKYSTDDLGDILPCRFDEVTLPMLGAAFFEQGWLAPTRLDIHPSDPVALGDLGYVTEGGEFVIVDNIHRAKSGILSWKGDQRFRNYDEELEGTSAAEIIVSQSGNSAPKFSSCNKEYEDTSAAIIVSQSGESYHRRRQVHFPVSFDLIN